MIGRLVLALFCFVMAGHAIVTGNLLMKQYYTREESPFAYWAGTATYVGLGIFSVVLAFTAD